MTQAVNAAVNVATVAYLPGGGAHLLRVRASIGGTGPALTITGVPDESVSWTRDRLYAATGNAGLNWPHASVRLDLFPTPPSTTRLSTTDTGIDVALAVAALAAAGQLPTEGLQDVVFIGELGLDGTLRTPKGLPERLAAAANAGFAVLAPAAGLATPTTATAVAGITAWPVQHLRELAAQLRTAARTGEGWPTPQRRSRIWATARHTPWTRTQRWPACGSWPPTARPSKPRTSRSISTNGCPAEGSHPPPG